jgi:hypothetical protein
MPGCQDEACANKKLVYLYSIAGVVVFSSVQELRR